MKLHKIEFNRNRSLDLFFPQNNKQIDRRATLPTRLQVGKGTILTVAVQPLPAVRVASGYMEICDMYLGEDVHLTSGDDELVLPEGTEVISIPYKDFHFVENHQP